MVAWFQGLVATGYGIFLFFLALIGSIAIGVRLGGESVLLRLLIGIAALAGSLFLIDQIL